MFVGQATGHGPQGIGDLGPEGTTVGPIAGYRPRANRTFANSPTGYAYYEDVLNSPKFLEGDAISAVRRLSLYGRADYTLFDGVDWTTEMVATRRELEHKGWRQFFPQIASANGYDVAASTPGHLPRARPAGRSGGAGIQADAARAR